ncbi:hypothetical protein ACVIGB_000874 [Bradyrhizobium sp. USDA 4341]
MDVAQIDSPAAREKVGVLMMEVAKASLAVGSSDPFNALRVYAGSDGDLRICVVIGELQQVIVPAGEWRELSPDDILAKERKRFSSADIPDPSSLQIPYGHIGFLVKVPGFSASACVISVNDFYKELNAADKKLGEFSAAEDPRKNVEAFAAFRKDAFETLADGLRNRNQVAAEQAIHMLMWASVNMPGKGEELRKMLANAIAKHDRAGIVMQLIEHNNRVATLIGEDLSLPDGLSDVMQAHKMTGVADTLIRSDPTTRKTH